MLKSIKSLLIAVRERAKELRCMSHPRDRECLYKFIVACHKAGTNFNGYDLYSHLIASGVHNELAKKLRNDYENGRELLKVYRHGTISPPTPEVKKRQLEHLFDTSNEQKRDLEETRTN